MIDVKDVAWTLGKSVRGGHSVSLAYLALIHAVIPSLVIPLEYPKPHRYGVSKRIARH